MPRLVNGGSSYGSRFTGSDGWQVDAQGLPEFSGDFLDVTVHEFVHSYSNPLVDKSYPQMAKVGDQLNEPVWGAMHRRGYGETGLDRKTIRQILNRKKVNAAMLAKVVKGLREELT